MKPIRTDVSNLLVGFSSMLTETICPPEDSTTNRMNSNPTRVSRSWSDTTSRIASPRKLRSNIRTNPRLLKLNPDPMSLTISMPGYCDSIIARCTASEDCCFFDETRTYPISNSIVCATRNCPPFVIETPSNSPNLIHRRIVCDDTPYSFASFPVLIGDIRLL